MATRTTATTTTTTTAGSSTGGQANPTGGHANAATTGAPGGGGTGGGGGGGGGGAGGGGGGVGPPGGPPAGGAFALAPAYVAQPNAFIDYGTRYGQRLYEQSVAPLPHEYDCEEEGLREFIRSLKDHAIEANWTQTLTMPQDGQNYMLLDNYGTLKLETIQAYANTYIGQQVRAAQDSFAMYKCLAASLSETARNRVASKLEQYTVNNQFDGLLYFKSIVQIAQVDTRATVTDLRTKLLSLDQHMQTVDSDISQFNDAVTAWRQALDARGERVGDTDLMVNLFRGYRACIDHEFQQWIKMKQHDYNEGQDVSPDALMSLALNTYNTMIKDGTWKAPTKDQETIVTLTAKIEQLQKKLKSNNKGKNNNKIKKGDKQQDDKAKGKTGDTKGKTKREYPAWKKKAPTGNEPSMKDVSGRTTSLVQASPDVDFTQGRDCKKGNQQSGKSDTNGNNELQINRNMTAILEDDDSSI